MQTFLCEHFSVNGVLLFVRTEMLLNVQLVKQMKKECSGLLLLTNTWLSPREPLLQSASEHRLITRLRASRPQSPSNSKVVIFLMDLFFF